MTLLHPELVETLLNMSESDVLDFKRDQYVLAGASDETKAKLLKDVLAFANAWKTDDAHIVIGVDENPGARAQIVGVAAHLDDADLQQLVCSKTNVPVSFEYLPLTVDGLPVGVLRIRKDQQRPIFLKRPFGNLQPNVVYIRRGSSTAAADPTEIARMGAAAAATTSPIPLLSIELGDPEGRTVLGSSATIKSVILEVPDYEANAAEWAARIPHLSPPPASLFPSWSRPDKAKLTAYRKEMRLLVRMGFCVRNIGKVLVEDARVLVKVPKHDGLRVLDLLQERPRGPMDIPPAVSFAPRARTRSTSVADRGDHWEIDARLGKLQPDATVWSLPFWMGRAAPLALNLVVRVFGDNIPTPIEMPLTISITTERQLEVLGTTEPDGEPWDH